MRTDAAEPVRLKDYRVPDYLIDKVDLDVKLHPAATRVTARLAIRPNPLGRPNAALVLDGDGLAAKKIALDGLDLDLHAAEAWNGVVTPDQFTLHAPPNRRSCLKSRPKSMPAANTRLMGLYRSGAAYCTQCEAEGFRRITYFLDRPDVLSVYAVRLEADQGRGAGPAVERQSGSTRAKSQERRAISRSGAILSKALLSVRARRRRSRLDSRQVHHHAPDARSRSASMSNMAGRTHAAYAMDALKRAMAWDERSIGREYDLDVFNIVAVSDFNMGAMENKGLNIFNDKYVLASPATATDADYAQIEAVIAHEYFHNWTGNRITCRDWFQLCLKEGLTVFRDQEFSADMRSAPVRPHHRCAHLARRAISGGRRAARA